MFECIELTIVGLTEDGHLIFDDGSTGETLEEYGVENLRTDEMSILGILA